jgi:hypothetical protein
MRVERLKAAEDHTVNSGISEEYIKELKSHIVDLQKQLEKGSLSDMERQTFVKALKEKQDSLKEEKAIRQQMEEYHRKNPIRIRLPSAL